MVVFYIRRALMICFIFTSVSSHSLSLCASEEIYSEMKQKSLFKKFHTKWIIDYLQSITYETPSDEIIHFAADVKKKVQKFTHSRSHYSVIFREVHKRMKKRNIKLHRHYFDRITVEIRKYEKFLDDKKKIELPVIDFDVLNMSQYEITGCVGVFCAVLLSDIEMDKCDYISGIATGIGIDAMMNAKFKGDINEEDLLDD